MSLFERVVSQQVEFLFVVGRSGPLNRVALHVLFRDRDALLHVLPNQTCSGVGVGPGEVTNSQVELESLRDGGFQRRYPLEEVHRLGPRGRVGVVNQRLSIENGSSLGSALSLYLSIFDT